MTTVEASFNSGSEVSHALWCRTVRDTSALVPKCPLDISAPVQKCETFRHQTHSAEMSWVRSVLGPKCRRFKVSVHRKGLSYAYNPAQSELGLGLA